jgi:hypothetical protein
MPTLEITVQRRTPEGWPVVTERRATDLAPPARGDGLLTLDPDVLLAKQDDPDEYGLLLGQALFQGAIADELGLARKESLRAVGERLHLFLHVEAPDLRPLHWERLYAPPHDSVQQLTGGVAAWHCLALDQQVPFSLYLPTSTDRRFPPIDRSELRALLVVAGTQAGNRFGLDTLEAQPILERMRTASAASPATPSPPARARPPR